MTFPLIKLDTNENPYGPSPKAILAYLRSARFLNRYPDYVEYRRIISSRIGVEPEQVFPTPGSDRGIQLLLQCLSKNYERVVIPSPAFLMYLRFSKPFFRKVEQASCWLGRGWEEVLKRSGKDAVLILGSPNNPTGETVERKLAEAFLEEFGIVVVDEAYSEYCGESLAPLLNQFENLVLARTFSKAYGLASLRSGYLAGNQSILRKAEEYAGPFDVPAPAVEASKAALEDEWWLKTVVEATSANRSRMINGLSRVDGVKPYDSKANFILLKVNDAQNVFEKLLANNIRIRLVTPEWGGIEEKFLRVTVGTLTEVDQFLCGLRRVMN
jgi:histidinol-phosphate aminotransferase